VLIEMTGSAAGHNGIQSPDVRAIKRSPDAFTGHRAIQDAVASKRIRHRVVDRGKQTHRRRLAAAFHAERIGRASRIIERQIECRKIVPPAVKRRSP